MNTRRKRRHAPVAPQYAAADINDRCDPIDPSDRIEVLPPEEPESMRTQGLAIVPPPENEKHEEFYEYQNQSGEGAGSRGRVYVRHFSLGNTPGGIFGKLILGAVLLGLVIVFLPLALFVIGAFLVLGLLARLRRR